MSASIFVEDWNFKAEGKVEQGIGDSGGDELGVARLPFPNDAEGKYRIHTATQCERLHAEGNFKRTRDAHDFDIGARGDDAEFGDSSLDQPVHQVFIVATGDDGQTPW